MFERYTERARQVIVLAQEEARLLKHNYIGLEHVLLGLIREEEGIGARVLEQVGITLDQVRTTIKDVIGEGDEAVTGQIPFTPRAKKVLEMSLREALALGHNYIGTEHVLLGLVREIPNPDSDPRMVSTMLKNLPLDAEEIRDWTIKFLSPPRPQRRPQRTQRVRKRTAFELTDGEQRQVDEIVGALLILNVRQWLAIKTAIDEIDPPAGTFVREPLNPNPSEGSSSVAVIRLEEGYGPEA